MHKVNEANFTPANEQSALRSHSYDPEWALDKRYIVHVSHSESIGWNAMKSFDLISDANAYAVDYEESMAWDTKIWDNKEDRWLE